ncbi:DUF4878 domain-containing protein [Vreelandella sp. GE22]
MKRNIFLTAAALLAAALLTACSGGEPEDTVETFFQATADGDVEKAIDQVSFASVGAEEMVAAKGKVQMLVGDLQNRIAANDGLDSVETVNTNMLEDDQRAVIQSTIHFNNGKSMNENTPLVKEDGDWKISLE